MFALVAFLLLLGLLRVLLLVGSLECGHSDGLWYPHASHCPSVVVPHHHTSFPLYLRASFRFLWKGGRLSVNQSPLTLSPILSCPLIDFFGVFVLDLVVSRSCLERFSTLVSKILILSSFALSFARRTVGSIIVVLEAFGPSLVLGESASGVSFEL